MHCASWSQGEQSWAHLIYNCRCGHVAFLALPSGSNQTREFPWNQCLLAVLVYLEKTDDLVHQSGQHALVMNVDTQQPRSLTASEQSHPLLARHAWVPPAGAQAVPPRAGPEPAEASWVTSVTVWVGLIVGFWVLTAFQEVVKCILYEEIPMCFISRLAFSIDSGWRKCKSEEVWINAQDTLHHGKCPGKMQIRLLF